MGPRLPFSHDCERNLHPLRIAVPGDAHAAVLTRRVGGLGPDCVRTRATTTAHVEVRVDYQGP